MSGVRDSLPFPPLKDAPAVAAPAADWHSRVAALGVKLSESQLGELSGLVRLLLGASTVANLTAIREPDLIWERLIFDTLVLVPWLEKLPAGASVADIGCGGGFPGLPLAIAAPHLRYTLVDATRKKIQFVSHAVEQLELTHVRAVAERAEQLSAHRTGKLRESFDLVTARAVAPLPVLLELTSPFAKAPTATLAGGRLMLVKGEHAADELAAAEHAMKLLLLELETREETPSSTLLFFSKQGPTPARYPRGNGAPKRRPL